MTEASLYDQQGIDDALLVLFDKHGLQLVEEVDKRVLERKMAARLQVPQAQLPENARVALLHLGHRVRILFANLAPGRQLLADPPAMVTPGR